MCSASPACLLVLTQAKTVITRPLIPRQLKRPGAEHTRAANPEGFPKHLNGRRPGERGQPSSVRMAPYPLYEFADGNNDCDDSKGCSKKSVWIIHN